MADTNSTAAPSLDVTSSAASRKWPFDTARSTGTTCKPLLAALLASSVMDEISTSSDFADVEQYIRGQHAVTDAEDRTAGALMFWVYPTGYWGPYRETEEGGVKQHGLLVTIERGARVMKAVQAIRAALPKEGTAHVHVAAS